MGGHAEVLQFMPDAVDAEAIGDRRVDIERFARDPAGLARPHDPERAHVVQAICQLDHDHPDVLRHREHHLAEVLRLRLGARAELDLRELTDPVNEFRDLGAELRFELGLRGRRVLDHVVQDRRHQALVIHAHAGEYARHRNGVIDIGFAGEAALALVGLGTKQVGPVDLADLFSSEVGL
jgi:hypothetical protein